MNIKTENTTYNPSTSRVYNQDAFVLCNYDLATYVQNEYGFSMIQFSRARYHKWVYRLIQDGHLPDGTYVTNETEKEPNFTYST